MARAQAVHRPPTDTPRRAPTPTAGVVLLVIALTACRPAPLRAAPVVASLPTHGTVVGEVSSTAAVVWARCERASTLRVQLDGDPREHAVAVGPETDFTGKIALASLSPATAYPYRAWCADAAGDHPADAPALRGSFRTAPDPRSPAALRLQMYRSE